MVLRAQEVAPSGINRTRNFDSKMQVFTSKAKLSNFWHLKGSGQALKTT